MVVTAAETSGNDLAAGLTLEEVKAFDLAAFEAQDWEALPGFSTTWWKNVNPYFLDAPFVPLQYSPTGGVTRRHEVMSSFRDNQFDPYSSSYTNGILIAGSVFLVLGILMCLSLPVAYCCVGKNKQCCSSIRKTSPRKSNLKWWLLLIYAGATGGAVLSIIGFVRANGAIDESATLLGKIGDLLSLPDAAVAIGTKLMSKVTGRLQLLSQGIAGCLSTSPMAVQAADAILNDWQQSLQGAKSDLNLLLDDQMLQTADQVYDIQATVDDTEQYRTIIVWTVFGLDCFVLAVLAIFAMMMVTVREDRMKWMNRMAHCSTLVTVPTGMILIVGSWCVTVGTVMLTLSSADYCVDPDSNVLTLVDDAYVRYYVTCVGDNPVLNAISTVLVALKDGASQMETIAALESSPLVNDATCDIQSATESLLDFSQGYYGLYKLTERTGELLSCKTINVVINRTSHELMCQDLSSSLVFLWSGSLVLAVCLMLLMILWRMMLSQRVYVAQELEDTPPSYQKALESRPSSIATVARSSNSNSRKSGTTTISSSSSTSSRSLPSTQAIPLAPARSVAMTGTSYNVGSFSGPAPYPLDAGWEDYPSAPPKN
jgi:hypothetical protein